MSRKIVDTATPDFRDCYRPRLRIAIDPIYIQAANLNSSSTYHKYVSLVRELVKRGHFVYWCVPDSKYVPNEIENHPNVGIIRTSYIQDQFVIDGLVTDQFFNMFNRVAGKYHVDAICTSRTSLGLVYKRTLDPPRFHDIDDKYTDKGYGMPVVLIEEFPQTRERQHSSRSYWLSQCTGYLAADRSIFLSAHNREECTKEMVEIFRTSHVDNFVEKSRIIPAGIECDELEKYYSPDRWQFENKFNVLSIGRIFGPTHVQFLMWYDYLYKRGRDDVCLTISLSGALGGPMKAKLKNIGFDFENSVGRQFKVMENNPRPNFLSMIKKFHCFIAIVSHLDHPTGILEAMYLGLPGILPVSDYQETFFKDYPFVVEPADKAGLLAKLLWIRDNPQKARDMVAPWRDIIREKYNAPDNVALLANEIETVARQYINNFKTSGGVLDLVKEFKGERYAWTDVVAYLRKAGMQGVSIGNMDVRTTFTYARGAIHHAMGYQGYVDDCTGPIETFVRRDVFDRENGKRLPIKKKGIRHG